MAAPTINISNSPGLTLIDAAESTTGWVGFNDGTGGNPLVANSVDVFIQNTASNATKVSGATLQNKGIWFDNTTGIDMTVTGRHLYMWIQITTVSLMSTIANGGLYIKVASDAAGNNWSKWFVSGSDRFPGGWVRFVIDLNKTPSETAATAATLTSVRFFGAGMKSTGTSVAENLYIDRMDYGDGLQIEDGDATTPASWQELFEADDAVANKYGIVTKKAGVFFVRGGLAIGDASSSQTTLWDDVSGAVVVFENPLYHNGTALVSAVDAPNLYKIDVVGNATGTTDVKFGTVVGTGDDRQGIGGGIITSDGPKFSFDGETDIADLDTINLYGVLFQGAGVIQLSGSTKTDAIGCTFTDCDEVQPNDAEFLNVFIISPQPDRGLEVVVGHNIKNVTFVAGPAGAIDVTRAWQGDISTTPDAFVEMTDECNSAAAGDVIPFPTTEGNGDYFAVGSMSKYGSLSVDVGTAGVGGTMKLQYWNGSEVVDLSGVVDNTNGLTTAGVNTITFDVPLDWEPVSLLGPASSFPDATTSVEGTDEDPLFYVFFRLITTYTTNPILDEVDVVDTVEHHVNFPARGTFALVGFKFFGFAPDGAPKWHGENSGILAIADSYAESNQNGESVLNDTVTAVGQSFTGDGTVLKVARFFIRKSGAPTGNAIARLYAHSGTFGTSSVPTGAALDSSATVDVSLLDDTDLKLVQFAFSGGFTLVNTTKYVIVIEYTNGDPSNDVGVGHDTSSPSHAGNKSTFTGSWAANAGTDLIFYVHSDSDLILNASGGTNITEPEVESTTFPSADTVVNNNVSITLTPLEPGSVVQILKTSDGTEADPGTTNSGTSYVMSIASGLAVDITILFVDEAGDDARRPICLQNRTFTADGQLVINQQDAPNFAA